MTFGHDFFGNSTLAMYAETMGLGGGNSSGLIGPGGEQQLPQPVETTLTTQTSDEEASVAAAEEPNWTERPEVVIPALVLFFMGGFAYDRYVFKPKDSPEHP